MNSNQKLTIATALLLVTTFPGQLLSQSGSPKNDLTSQSDAAKLQDDLTKAQAKLDDWPQLKRYAAENSALPEPAPGEARVVF